MIGQKRPHSWRSWTAAIIAVGAALVLAAPAWSGPAARLSVRNYQFVLTLANGERLTSPDLTGATLDIKDPTGRPVTARIDAVRPAAERLDIPLLSLSVKDPASGARAPMCGADYQGRRAAFPVSGRWDRRGRFVADKSAWFLTCVAGSQGKCILWGYDPWRRGPHGENLALYYQACQHMVPADYDGSGRPHTRNGTAIDIWDAAGVLSPSSQSDVAFAFEAGWAPTGAVCVARTRWIDLLTMKDLLAKAPRLAGRPCDAAEARRRGALLFNRSRIAPPRWRPSPGLATVGGPGI